MLTRLIDYLKGEQITALCTDLTTAGEGGLEQTEVGVSSLMDTWLLLKAIEEKGERNRGLYILKSRGMSHSNQIREFILSDQGIQLLDVYTGTGGVLTGAARSAQEAQHKAEAMRRRQDMERKQREMQIKERVVEAQITSLRAEFEAEREELLEIIGQDKLQEEVLSGQKLEIARMRQADRFEKGKKAGNQDGEGENE
jgi:circadian clock protein KaiC